VTLPLALMLVPLLTIGDAVAGYADVDEAGYPSLLDRQLHLWTNAARVDPEAFEDDYQQSYAHPCSFYVEFSEDEQTPKAPVYYDRNLNEAARFHSQDMSDNDHFAHESSDGTSFGDRLARFYDTPFVGENIAWNYPNPYDTVFKGWMCSPDGHRGNIMSKDWTELGTSIVGAYATQDFGGGAADSAGAVAMAAHEPASATDDALFLADWQDAEAPVYLQVIVDGEATPLELTWGTDLQGVFSVEVDVEAGDCHTYMFEWETASGTTGVFPETGSYTYGIDCEDSLGWVPNQSGGGGGGSGSGGGSEGGSGSLDTDDIRLVGCATTPSEHNGRTGGGLATLGMMGLLALGRRRRREGHATLAG
jgi:MYXO-CTERM domain-containing protein